MGVAECKKTMILKTDFLRPLKLSFSHISRVSDSRTNCVPTCEMCRCTWQNFVGKV